LYISGAGLYNAPLQKDVIHLEYCAPKLLLIAQPLKHRQCDSESQWMAIVPNGVEILPKISTS